MKMYNEEAGKKQSTMATGFALISIDPEEGTPSTALGPKMGMEATSLSRTLKAMEEKGSRNWIYSIMKDPLAFSYTDILLSPW